MKDKFAKSAQTMHINMQDGFNNVLNSFLSVVVSWYLFLVCRKEKKMKQKKVIQSKRAGPYCIDCLIKKYQ